MVLGTPVANPWHNTNGQKFFNQFLDTAQSKPVPTHRQIPDQYNYNRQLPKQAQRNEESAFASFNSSPKTVHNSGTSSSSGSSSNGRSNWRTEERSFKPEKVFNNSKQEVQLQPSKSQVSLVCCYLYLIGMKMYLLEFPYFQWSVNLGLYI